MHFGVRPYLLYAPIAVCYFAGQVLNLMFKGGNMFVAPKPCRLGLCDDLILAMLVRRSRFG